jgi:hypothetical protein
MSIKRSSSGRQPVRGLGGDTGKSSTKIDKQELFEELHRRADAEPFSSTDLGVALGVTETVASKHLLLLSCDGFVERLEGGKFSAAPMREIGLAQFLKELAAAAKNPQREKDLQDIARLKSNNDIMRDRLMHATAERDRYLTLLKKHGIDPTEDPGIGAIAPAPEPLRAPAPESPRAAAPQPVSAEAPTNPITVGSGASAPEPAPAAPAEPEPLPPPPFPPPPGDPNEG